MCNSESSNFSVISCSGGTPKVHIYQISRGASRRKFWLGTQIYGVFHFFGNLKKPLATLGRPHLVGPIFEGAVSVKRIECLFQGLLQKPADQIQKRSYSACLWQPDPVSPECQSEVCISLTLINCQPSSWNSESAFWALGIAISLTCVIGFPICGTQRNSYLFPALY